MNWNRLVRTKAPTQAPLTPDELADWVRQDLVEDYTVIEQLIQDATDYIEGPNGIGVALGAQEWRYRLDGFPGVIEIPLSPVASVEVVKYVDTEGAEQTLAADQYKADVDSKPARIAPAINKSWPSTAHEINAVTVEFTAGYNPVPGDLRRAIALLAAYWYDNRSAVHIGSGSAQEMPFAVDAILNRYRVGRFA